MRDQRTIRGFTLAELLVALAIAGALVALGLQHFAAAEQQAQQNADVGQANALAQAVSTYYAVNGCYPEPTTAWGSLPGGLAAYYGTTSIPAYLLYLVLSGPNSGGAWVVTSGAAAQTIAIAVSAQSTMAASFATIYVVNGVSVPVC
jgi:prepilin-type N-terminal cleavage/methylation domain-containing protein